MGIPSNEDSQKKTDILLREQSGFLTSIIDTVGALIAVLDSKGRIACFNKACEKTTGYSFEEVKGRAVWDFLLLPEEIEPVKNVFKQLRAGDFPNQYENAWIMKDGSRRLFSWSNTALLEGGAVAYVIATGVDITERKRIEDALRSSEERFRTLVDQSPFSIQILSTDGRTVQVNRAWEELWGITPKMLEGYNILEDQQLVEKGLLPFIQKGFVGIASEIPAAEYDPQKTISGAGPKRWVRGFIYPVTSNGKITEIVLMHEDVTKQKQAERQLKESEEKFRTIFESASDAIILFNENSFFDCNSAALKMFGYTDREEFCKNHPADISPPTQPDGTDSRQGANEKIAAAFRVGKEFFEWTHRRANGQEFPAEVLLTPLELDGKPVIQGTLRDITARKRLEDSLRFLVESTSAVTGRDFFRKLVRGLANVLGMRYALVGELIQGEHEKIQTTAVWAYDDYGENFEYELAFSPCENVVGKELCCYPEKIQSLFPKDPLLVEMGIESYIGTPLFDHKGNPLGILSVMHDKPLMDPTFMESIVAIFASRAGAELERLRAEEDLRRARDELEQRVIERTADLAKINQELQQEVAERKQAEEKLHQAATVFEYTNEAIAITDAERNIVAVNQAFCDITGYKFEEILGKNPRLMKSGQHDEAFYRRLWASVNHSGHWKGEIWNRRKNGELFPAWENISVVKDEQGNVVNYISVFSDISIIKESEKRLNYLAHYDALTDLPNRLLFSANLHQALELAKRHESKVALLFLDLDRFKFINDTLGHAYGDRLLKAVAKRLQHCVRAEDTVARLGGDEFTIILTEVSQAEDAAILAEKVNDVISKPFAFDGKDIVTSASVGISVYPDDADNSEDLAKAADAAMYRAKERGRNTYRFYKSELATKAYEHFSLEHGLRKALDRDEFVLYYQPQVALDTGKIVGMEALIRWHHPETGLETPAKFITIAEDTGLINMIGEWVLHTACAQAKLWQLAGLPAVKIAVNLSGRQILRDYNLMEKVRSALENSKLDPHCLVLEVTENVLQTSEKSINMLANLKSLGVSLAIDDFGIGYSSLTSIKRLPIDIVKVDRSFVQDIPSDSNDMAIAAAIIAMGHNLNLRVVAEGAETKEQLAFLKTQGCDEMQGFIFSEPLTSDGMYNILKQDKQLTEVAHIS